MKALIKKLKSIFADSEPKTGKQSKSVSRNPGPSRRRRQNDGGTSESRQGQAKRNRPRGHRDNRHRHRDDRRQDRQHGRHQREEKLKAEKTAPIQPQGKSFSELGLNPDIVEKLGNLGFTQSTEVQEKSMPVTLSGKNVFCSSETGSGKTLSFLLPMIQKFHNNALDQALILCPTREIAIQIQKTLQRFEDPTLTSALVIGGTNMEQQKQALLDYPKILVATPGRLLDMLKTGNIWLQYTGYVVLDEADRMLDMGFEEDLMKIHAELTGPHQTLLFSATLFPEIKKMAKRYADDFQEIVIGNPTSVAGSVEHVVVEMADREKFQALKYLIRRNPGKMMVFFNTIRETSTITQQLKRQHVQKVDCIHSKVDQSGRERLINYFRSEQLDVLLASDVAARGIDIPNVELVVNYDIPNNSEEYIHRVGRTGRAGKSGIAISFYTHKDKKKREAIETLIEGKIKRRRGYRGLI